jgi:putative ABC transport system permease protein
MTILSDIRYAVRSLWHSKGFAAAAIACLGFGIGLNTTIFSIIDGVMLQPYPFEDPERILVLGAQHRQGDQAGVSPPDLRDWKTATTAFSSIAGVAGRSLTVTDGAGEPERYLGARISWNLFRLLGERPILGRDFVESDDQRNAAGVVILSHAVWANRYRSDPGVIGRSVLVDTIPHTVVGVMPPNFSFPENQRLWVPLEPQLQNDARDARYLFTFGRLRPDVSADRGLADLNAIAARLAREYPSTNENWGARIETLHQAFLPPDVKLILGLMMAGVTLVLFIACSNVANLLLARAARRRRELAVRVAIGAGRGRIVRQLLTESVMLALASVPLGLTLAVIGTRLIAAQIPPDDVPYYIQWRVDFRSLVYAITVASTTALIFGLAPAIQATRRELQEGLREGARGNTGSRALVRNGLVVAQVSLALVALVGALLFVRSFRNMDSYELGFDTNSALTLRFYMTGDRYQPRGAKQRQVEDILRRVEALPGVEAAFASNWIPISGGGGGGPIEVEGRAGEERNRPQVSLVGVTPNVHRVLAMRVRRGRDFTDSDANRDVAVVNETMARRVWPGEDPIGRRFRLWSPGTAADPDDPERRWLTVIGVTSDAQLFGIDPGSAEAPAAAFAPYAHGEAFSTGLTVRASGDPAALASAVRSAIRASDPGLPIALVRTLDEVHRLAFWQFGLYGWIFGAIGVVGLLLASVGVYGMLSYSVSQRTQELGVRLALGADRGHVLRLIVGQGLGLAGIGVAAGLGLAALGTPLARSLLYNVSPFDPLSFTVVSAFLIGVALLASYVPARRATRVDPLVALRDE